MLRYQAINKTHSALLCSNFALPWFDLNFRLKKGVNVHVQVARYEAVSVQLYRNSTSTPQPNLLVDVHVRAECS